VQHYGWRLVFYVAAAAPMAMTLVCWWYLPESIRFLVGRGKAPGATYALLKQIAPKAALPSIDELRLAAPSAVHPDHKITAAPVRALFSNGLARSTALIWALCMFTSAFIRIFSMWLPSLMMKGGYSLSEGALTLTLFYLASTIGMGIVGWLIEYFGPAKALGWALVCTALSTLAFAATTNMTTVIVVIVLIGLFQGVGVSGGYAIAAQLYPTRMRSTGLGWSMGVGRTGTVIGPLLIPPLLSIFAFTPNAIYLAIAILPAMAVLVAIFMRPNTGPKEVSFESLESPGDVRLSNES
jgi:AAHS family 4-hydroxybenzoate transporter-like MFS transporter